MANPVDQVLCPHASQERQHAAMPELPNDQPHQSPKQSHAEDQFEQIEATGRENPCWRTGKLQNRKEHHRADLQPTSRLIKKSPAPTRPLSCLHRLEEGLRRGLACNFLGNHEEVQHKHLPCPSHQNRCDMATSAVFFNSSIGDWFQTTVGIRDFYSHPPPSTYFCKGS